MLYSVFKFFLFQISHIHHLSRLCTQFSNRKRYLILTRKRTKIVEFCSVTFALSTELQNWDFSARCIRPWLDGKSKPGWAGWKPNHCPVLHIITSQIFTDFVLKAGISVEKLSPLNRAIPFHIIRALVKTTVSRWSVGYIPTNNFCIQ